jgi:hypothetical protein
MINVLLKSDPRSRKGREEKNLGGTPHPLLSASAFLTERHPQTQNQFPPNCLIILFAPVKDHILVP